MSHKYDDKKQRENKDIENPQTVLYDAIQNSDISLINKLLNDKFNEAILYEDDSQMSSKIFSQFIFI